MSLSIPAPAISREPVPADRTKSLLALHRFLAARSFYPLLLCTLLAGSFFITRALIAHHVYFRFLVWNLFLAWIPYWSSVLAVHLHRNRSASRVLLAGVWLAWLAMFPNAPYIFTDFVHLREAPLWPVPWWFDLGMMIMFALAGCFVGIVSLRIMHDLLRARVGEIAGWLFVAVVAILSGFGIYLGRFERYNSWDLLFRPHRVLPSILDRMMNPLSHPRTLGVTLMFGAMVMVTYVMFVSTTTSECKFEI